jgi:hypothetical protein
LAASVKIQKMSERNIFEEILNDPRVNSREVGEREGIEYFQIIVDDKRGFRDLDGNIVIEPKFDFAAMFSEGLSAVEINKKTGFIDTKGNFIIEPKFEAAGDFHEGLARFRENGKYGFINKQGDVFIEPKFYWVGDFSEGLCAVRNEADKYSYINMEGELIAEYQFDHALDFENGLGKIKLNKQWGAVDKNGIVVIKPIHKHILDF